jgi:hypothetical protein
MTEPSAFYVEVLRARLRGLNSKIAETGRWDEAMSALSKERDEVECELAQCHDTIRNQVPQH